MNLKDKYNGIRQEVKGLMDAHPDGMPTDVAKKVTSLLEQADGLKAQIDLADRAGGMADYTAPAGAAARETWGEEHVDEQSWRETNFTVVGQNGHLEQKSHRWYVPSRIDNKGYGYAMEAYMAKGENGLTERELKTLREGSDGEGGYLIAPDLQAQMLSRMAATATVRQYAKVITTVRDSVIMPTVKGNSDLYGSEMQGVWGGENPASGAVRANQTFGQVVIPVNTLMAEVLVSRNLLEDAGFDLGGYISEKIADDFSAQENYGFILGDGVSRPRGMLLDVDTANGITSVATGASSTLTKDGILDLYGALPEQYERGAVWLMSKSTVAAARKLEDTAGNPVWGDLGVATNELVGFPVVRDYSMPSVAANAYPMVFGDLKGYTIVDRVGISIQRLVEKYADQNIIGFLARKRVGGRLSEPYLLRVAKVASS